MYTKEDCKKDMAQNDENDFGNMQKYVKRIARRVASFEKIDDNTIVTQGHTVESVDPENGMISIDGEVIKWTECRKYISF